MFAGMSVDPIKADLEFVTPAIWRGADMANPEVRAASLKGLLRYWWRVWAGTFASTTQELYQWESEIFGSTSHASPLVVQVKSIGSPCTTSLSHSTAPTYFLFPFRSAAAAAYDARTQIEVTLSLRPGWTPKVVAGLSVLEWAAGSLWLLVHLGGVGARSRRGFGSLKWVEKPPKWPPNLPEPVLNEKNYPEKVKEGIDRLKNSPPPNMELYRKKTREERSKKIIHCLTNIELYLFQNSYTNWKGALEDAAQKLSEYRRTLKPLIRRAAFGLPIVLRSGGALRPQSHNRRASPLHLRVFLQDKYVLLAVFLKGEFLPNGEKIVLKGGEYYNAPSLDDPKSIIADWLRENKAKLI